MKLPIALRLGRVSNLPTVTSNVLAAVALTGVAAGTWHVIALCLALSLFYEGGMFLNDAFDREIDRRERPERPIPSGAIDAASVFAWGFALLAAGTGLVAALAIAHGGGGIAIVSALALAAVIVFYDMHHKGNPLSPVVMGVCRAGVYTTAALSVSGSLDGAVLIGAGALIAYLIGLTYIAKQENLTELGNLWPLAFLALALAVAWPANDTALWIWIALVFWIVRALAALRAKKIRDAVTSLIAGISLLDGVWIANHEQAGAASVALVCFALTTFLQRFVPGT
ncbi:MAG TPA: UbiA family prenyltransferase [Kofleriaceae bacterium]|jgi:4-hydroxybenzoate polyprenyltransferase|nr:UbiA family prenyltransferase [Kofleriaceae bacterium]